MKIVEERYTFARGETQIDQVHCIILSIELDTNSIEFHTVFDRLLLEMVLSGKR